MKSKKFLGGWITIFLLTVCSCLALCSCDKSTGPSYSGDNPDSVWVTDIIQSTLDPSFSSIDEVLKYQYNLSDEKSVEEVFISIPQDVLTNVSTVCLKKHPTITIRDVITEYIKNQAVYDNLPTQVNNDSLNQQSATEEQHRPSVDVSYYYRIDTIDGKPQRVLVKEEKSVIKDGN